MHNLLAKGSWPGGFAGGTTDIPTNLARPRGTLVEDEVSQIVHDLKNPLAAIELEASLLDAYLSDASCVRGLRSVARIHDNVQFLDRIMQDLLDVCAFAAGELRMETAVVDVCTLVEYVIERVAGAALDRVFVTSNGPTVVRADEVRIQRVIANLIDNALRYSPDSSRVVIDIDGDDTRVRVMVADAGPGIPTVEMAQLFHRFRRGSNAHARMGSGLGLYTCKRIVEAHGGSIGAESACPGGSRFFFDLPR
jgi:K+-sensing histidine kinase KdpD